jgi:hypothetical protein
MYILLGALWTYHSKFNYNGEDGIHVTYDGGERRLFYSDISFNGQHGLSIRLDASPAGVLLSSLNNPTFAYRQITFVNGSSVRSNGYYGLWQHATCHPSLFAINGTLFERATYDAIRFDSCQHEWRPQKVIDDQFRSPVKLWTNIGSLPHIIYQAPNNVYPQYPSWIPVALLYANETGNTIFNVTWNRFLNNQHVGLRLNPVQNIIGDIANNSFIGHDNGALLIVGNQSNWIDDVYLRNVTLRILFNNFTNNQGKHFIVSLDLNELSPYQTILFMYNRLINNNVTSKISAVFNARTRMPGVLTIGSSHIRITRNMFANNHSQYELVSQLNNASAIIQASMNFFASIYPPPTTFVETPMNSYERNQYLQVCRISCFKTMNFEIFICCRLLWHNIKHINVNKQRLANLNHRHTINVIVHVVNNVKCKFNRSHKLVTVILLSPTIFDTISFHWILFFSSPMFHHGPFNTIHRCMNTKYFPCR